MNVKIESDKLDLEIRHKWVAKQFTRVVLAAGLMLSSVCLATAFTADSKLPEPITLSSGWLMQDVAQEKETGDVISKVDFAPNVFQPTPYSPPSTVSANPPTVTKVSDALRFAPRGPRGNGGMTPTALAEGWPLNPEPNRPSFSSGWVQAPTPSSASWYQATVPGTVLTTLVGNNVFPDPLYGENNRPNIIPESLARTAYWYRTEFTVPANFSGKQIWLNFDGINYVADVWVNGTLAGTIRGAFMRGSFNVTSLVQPGATAAVAILIHPPPHPGDPWEKTVANQRGPNGGGVSGPLGQDGPTFVASIGWDWVPGIRDRQIGIWQKVSLSASGPVLVQNPFVTTDLPLPKTDSADVTIEATVQNISDATQTGIFTGKLGDISFKSDSITLPAKSSQVVKLTPATTPQLHIAHPKLWWPNGFGEPHLYPLHLSFDFNGASSDTKDFNVGIRKIQYSRPTMADPKNLVLVVNGVPVFAKGGDWGMDEALKRLPHDRLEAQIRLHKEANYTILRNWVGQSTSEDLFDLCDKYGIMVWDEFFQANPANGLNPLDMDLYLANVRDTVLRYRNHPSIAIWCGRNEGNPPPAINAGNAQIIRELDQTRYYQSTSSGEGGATGVVSGGGGYNWRTPSAFYRTQNLVFNTECGSASIPNLESIQAWMPEKDWFDINFPNDDWAEHDFVTGANNAPGAGALQNVITARYGAFTGLPEFVRKAQLADYEAYRAMYESRMAHIFSPCTAIITWMSNPAQPCFVWQIYDYSLEPFASFFAVKKACEPIHIEMTQDIFHTVVVNHTAIKFNDLTARVQIYNLDGTKKSDTTIPLAIAPASTSTDLGAIKFPADVSPVHFVKLELRDAKGKLLSDNFYWRETKQDDFTALDTMPDVTLNSKITRHDADGNCLLEVTLANPTKSVAFMAHLQLRNQRTNARMLPVYYTDNYISLLPGESKTITIEAAAKNLGTDQPLVVLDGWNVTTKAQTFTSGGRSSIAPNTNAIVVRSVAKAAAN
jgi:Exo-beta-D-glucosaminidase Ig-fold domain/Glycosyl hydrolases family 2/Glycosyl hydrolases family 2, sugar binding domain/Glycosyl hydrolases family 2, TIM barrel domain